MRVVRMWWVMVGAWAACASLQAQAPAGATGLCKDGTYSNAASKDGACRGHKGVQTWYAAAGTAKPGAGTAKPGAQAVSSKPAATQPVAPQAAAPARPAPTPKAASAAPAQGPAPAGATGVCKDGTYSNAASKDGACRGHKGVQTWYAASAAPARGGAVGAAPAAPVTPRATPQAQPQTAQSQPAQSQPAPRPAPARTQAAPGGGNGQVWVNTETKVYHCSGDRYYGKTKQGAYMSEGDAQAKGFRADAGKPCPK